MPHIALSKRINAPVDTVFRMCTDFENCAQVISAIKRVEMLTDGPVRTGTRFKETRVMFGKEATEEMEVTSYRPNESFTLGTDSCGCRYEMRHTFRPDGDGTLIDFDLNATAKTFFARLMSPLSVLMMGSMKKAIDADFEEIKRAAESAGTEAVRQ